MLTDIKHPTVAGQSSVIYEEMSGGDARGMRITDWEKTQELRSGKYTLWDHCFELPHKHLEAKRKTVDSVTVGKVTHKLRVGGNEQLEIYDYPAGTRSDSTASIPTARHGRRSCRRFFRIATEPYGSAWSRKSRLPGDPGSEQLRQFAPGHKFTLERHFDANGQYLLTCVEHDAHQAGYRSDETQELHYENHFTCIPARLPYRPQRVTSRPVISGMQTATVVGPEGEEIFCDKYGRVKVQFHWDREGKKDADSSCWLRVAQVWAGKGWGAFFWPRIGHEVVVIFEEGDPDQPMIIGSVYNAANMPAFRLPGAKKFAGIKSATVNGSARKNFNGIIFVDEQGKEHLAIHSERHMVINTEFDTSYTTGRQIGQRVPGAKTVTVGRLPGTS